MTRWRQPGAPRATAVASSVALLAVVVGSAARGAGGDPVELDAAGDTAAVRHEAAIGPLLPNPAGPFERTFLNRHEDQPLDPHSLADDATCAACHATIVGEWRSSAHALASFDNPYYRASVDLFRQVTGLEESRFCGGCHDVALLPGDRMDVAVEPADPLAHAGISCNSCHGAMATSVDGNASLTLTTSAIPLPPEGDDETLARHRLRVASTALRTDELCISCHRGFLGPHTGNPHYLIGMDDGTAWQRSIYAGTGVARIDEVIEPQGCASCHMPEVDGHRSHRFPGSQTALASASDDPAALAATQDLLQRAAGLDIAALRRADGEWLLTPDGAGVAGGEVVTLDVVITNRGAGHRFPAGTLDLQDTWLEVEVRDRDGVLIAGAGTGHEASGDDPSAFVLRATPVSESGQPELHHVVSRMRAVAWNHTIDARDALVVRYALKLPENVDDRGPIAIEARLRHRRHHIAYRRAVCEATSSERGQAFDNAIADLGGFVIPGCEAIPVTELARASLRLGTGSAAELASALPRWRRLYDHALGLSHQVQERLDEARPSLAAALEAAETDRQRAMVLTLWASVAGHQGRTDEALQRLERAQSLLPDHPAVSFVRGEALAAVWRWEGAAEAFGRVTHLVPSSDQGWQRLAQSLVSLGRYDDALTAARNGLRLQPRDPALLLSQTLALEGLGAPTAWVTAARQAYLEHRPPDDAPGFRYRCFRDVPGCADERLPVGERQLTPPAHD